MSSLRNSASRVLGNTAISVREIAADAGLAFPVSLSSVIALLDHPREVTWDGDVVTPSGTALGGNVHFALRSDGSWSFHSEMHAGGLASYDYDVTGLYATTSGLTFAAHSSGHVQGTIGSGTRTDDQDQSGVNPIIRTNWTQIAHGKLWVTKQYDMTGLLGFIDDVAKDILDIGATMAGASAGVMIALTRDFFQVFGKGDIAETLGVLAGVAVCLIPGGAVFAVPAGVAVGLVTEAALKSRDMYDDEKALADRVFGSRLPTSLIRLTNLSGLSGRAFTMPGVDGRIYVNLGNALDTAVGYASTSYTYPGELLIHELTHAWQITFESAQAGALPAVVCRGIVNQVDYSVASEDVYTYGTPDQPWSSFNLEAQASIVDEWFGGIATPVVPNRKPMDPNDPYFHYIRDNIRAGVA